MLLPALGFLLAGASTALHLEEAAELPLESALEILDRLQDAVAARQKARPTLDDPTWTSCASFGRCIAEILARTHSDEVLMLRLYGGPLRIRLVVERIKEESRSLSKFELSLSRDPSSWAQPLADAVAQLFPEEQKPALVVVEPLVAPERPPRLMPWLALGLSAAAGTTAIVLGQSSQSAHDDIQRQVLDAAHFQPLQDRMERDARLSNVFTVVTLIGLAGTALLFSL